LTSYGKEARSVRSIIGKAMVVVVTVAVSLVVMVAVCPAAETCKSEQPAGAAEFFRGITGNWTGICNQSTNGEKADKKYFRATIRETDPATFESKFEYFRIDPATGKAVRAGDASVVTNITADGKATSRIVGKGTVLVDHKPKPLQHDLIESLAYLSPGVLQGTTSGAAKVSGMPLGLGKNGKVREGKSSWKLSGGRLLIDQTLKVGFRALFFTKSFNVAAHYIAQRGSDIAALMSEQARVSKN